MSQEQRHHAPVEYEKTDVEPRPVTRAIVLVMGASVLTALGLVGYVAVLQARQAARDPEPRALALDPGRQPPEPRLQETPFDDIQALRARERRRLESNGWVDREAGVVHIRIDDAMRLFVERAASGRLAVGPAPAPVASPAPAAPGAGR